LGADSDISKPEVPWICADLDGEVTAFRVRSLAGQVFPYALVDANAAAGSGSSARRSRPIAAGVHVSHILRKLGVPNRLEATAIAHHLSPPHVR
jgi:hypothetical protein